MSWSPQQDQAYYVYQHIRMDTQSPFYIGKGKGDRAASRHSRNPHWRNIARKHGVSVEIVASGLDEELAFLAEVELIDKYRRLGRDLCNMTEGGDGVRLIGEAKEKFLQKARDPDVNRRRSASLSASWSDPETKERRRAALIAAYSRKDVLERVSEAATRNNSRPDVREKISASAKAYWSTPGVKESRLAPLLAASKAVCARQVRCIEKDVVFPSVADAERWLQKTSNPKASHSAIVNACKGKLRSAYGYRWEYVESKQGDL